jgi:hypothetical protein
MAVIGDVSEMLAKWKALGPRECGDEDEAAVGARRQRIAKAMDMPGELGCLATDAVYLETELARARTIAASLRKQLDAACVPHGAAHIPDPEREERSRSLRVMLLRIVAQNLFESGLSVEDQVKLMTEFGDAFGAEMQAAMRDTVAELRARVEGKPS